MRFAIEGSGFSSLGVRVQGFCVQGFGFKVQHQGFRVCQEESVLKTLPLPEPDGVVAGQGVRYPESSMKCAWTIES